MFSVGIKMKYWPEVVNWTSLDGSKATPNGDVPVNTLKSTVDIHLSYKTNIINLSIEEGHFHDKIKCCV